MSLVGNQLSGFAADMERDSKAQRLELAAAVDAVARRGEFMRLANTTVVMPRHCSEQQAAASGARGGCGRRGAPRCVIGTAILIP